MVALAAEKAVQGPWLVRQPAEVHGVELQGGLLVHRLRGAGLAMLQLAARAVCGVVVAAAGGPGSMI